MSSPTLITAGAMPAAYRDAVAIARAAHRHDPEGVAAIWNGTPNQPALVWALGRLPGVLAAAVLADTGRALDLDEHLTALLRGLPHHHHDPRTRGDDAP